MTPTSKTVLKTYFEQGDRPSQTDFENLIDSSLNIDDDKASPSDISGGTADNKFITPKGLSGGISVLVKDASTTVKGIAEIATLAEVETGTDSERFVTPEGAKRAAEKHALIKKINGTAPDAAGNIEITSITGNAGSAGKLLLPKKINGIPFDGTADITIPTVASPPSPTVLTAILTAVQTNTTVTPVVLTGHTFVIPAGKFATITGNLIFTSSALTTGSAYGIKVAQGAGANGAAIGSWSIEVSVSSLAVASGLRGGGGINLAANANMFGEVVGTASTASLVPANNNSGTLTALIKNTATNADTTVTIMFRSEVAGSTITAQIGTAAVVVIS
jgi:hypothetical protein